MKILVTGGAGFIGKNLVNRLAKNNDDITVFDNLATGTLENIKEFSDYENVELQKGDVRNISDLENLFKNHFDVIFHLSAISTGVQSPGPFRQCRPQTP